MKHLDKHHHLLLKQKLCNLYYKKQNLFEMKLKHSLLF